MRVQDSLGAPLKELACQWADLVSRSSPSDCATIKSVCDSIRLAVKRVRCMQAERLNAVITDELQALISEKGVEYEESFFVKQIGTNSLGMQHTR